MNGHVRATSPGQDAAAMVIAGIAEQIKSGALRPGERILSERRLADRYGQSLYIIRLALGQMCKEGVLESRPRSGIYVAEAVALDERAVGEFPQTALADSFHLHDLPMVKETVLRFVVCGWNQQNFAIWQKVCSDFSQIDPLVTVRPLYPTRVGEYMQMIRSSDGFISTPANLAANVPYDRVIGFPMEALEGIGVGERYIQQSVISPGVCGGVPLSATLMIGMLNRRLLGEACATTLLAADSWLEVFELLTEWGAAHPHVPALNLHHRRPLNLGELLRMIGADTLAAEKGRLAMDGKYVHEVLDAAAHFYRRTPLWTGGPSGAAARMTFTCNYSAEFDAQSHFSPWVPPIAEGGQYLEGVNLGVVHPDSAYPDLVSRFLLYLASPAVQQQFAAVGGEHTVNQHVGDPFACYGPEVREVCRRVHAGASSVLGRAGFCSYHHTAQAKMVDERILSPLSESLLQGDLTVDGFCELFDQRYRELLENSP